MGAVLSNTGHGRMRRARATVTALVLSGLVAGCGDDAKIGLDPCDAEGTHLIAFASNRATNQFDIFLYDVDGGAYRLLQNLNSATAADSSPALSSDRSTIAFVSDRGSGADILLYDRASCTLGSIPAINSSFPESQPAFSGDALRITFVRDTTTSAGIRKRVRLVNGTSLRIVPLPNIEGTPGSNDWSPAPDRTATVIAFVTDRSGSADILLYDRGGDSLIALPDVNTGAAELDPALTPDARYLCFASDRAGGAGGLDLYLYDLTTHAYVTPLTNLNSAGDDRHPSLSPDGNTLAFQSDRAGTWDVLYFRRFGNVLSNPVELASSALDLHPSLRYP